jgi:hypothetical protein
LAAIRHDESANGREAVVSAGLRFVPERLIQNFGSLLCGATRFRYFPFHLACADFILRDAAWFTGIGLHYRRRSRLQLPGTSRSYKDVAIVAVEAFDQFHGFSPLVPGIQSSDCRKFLRFVLRQPSQELRSYFPTKFNLVGPAAFEVDYGSIKRFEGGRCERDLSEAFSL